MNALIYPLAIKVPQALSQFASDVKKVEKLAADVVAAAKRASSKSEIDAVLAQYKAADSAIDSLILKIPRGFEEGGEHLRMALGELSNEIYECA